MISKNEMSQLGKGTGQVSCINLMVPKRFLGVKGLPKVKRHIPGFNYFQVFSSYYYLIIISVTNILRVLDQKQNKNDQSS